MKRSVSWEHAGIAQLNITDNLILHEMSIKKYRFVIITLKESFDAIN